MRVGCAMGNTQHSASWLWTSYCKLASHLSGSELSLLQAPAIFSSPGPVSVFTSRTLLQSIYEHLPFLLAEIKSSCLLASHFIICLTMVMLSYYKAKVRIPVLLTLDDHTRAVGRILGTTQLSHSYHTRILSFSSNVYHMDISVVQVHQSHQDRDLTFGSPMVPQWRFGYHEVKRPFTKAGCQVSFMLSAF